MKLAREAREAICKSTRAALAKTNGHQGKAATILGVNLRTVQKRLASLFTAEERAEMAARYGWIGVAETPKEKSK